MPEVTTAVMEIPNLFVSILLVPTSVLVLLDSPETVQTVKVKFFLIISGFWVK